jgi:hypothetical protein
MIRHYALFCDFFEELAVRKSPTALEMKGGGEGVGDKVHIYKGNLG